MDRADQRHDVGGGVGTGKENTVGPVHAPPLDTRTVRFMSHRRVLGVALALALAACEASASTTLPPATEHGPGPASIWLTTDPAVPNAPVSVTMTSPDEPDILFAHTFAPGTAVRGAFATSEGRYRLAAFSGACAVDLVLGHSSATEVELTIDAGGCRLAVVRTGNMNDPAMSHDEPVVLITNGDRGNQTPVIEQPPPTPLPVGAG